jgi:hypothetical protein
MVFPAFPDVTPMAATGSIRIGISGWQYKPWRGVFYPKGLRHARVGICVARFLKRRLPASSGISIGSA